MYAPTAPSTSVPSAKGLLPDIPSALPPCVPAQSVENSVIWAPVVQPQPQLTHPLTLSEWVTLEGFESEPQSYDRGNVTVGEPRICFLPFTSVDCTIFSLFSFNDFIATAFPDLVKDLDIQI